MSGALAGIASDARDVTCEHADKPSSHQAGRLKLRPGMSVRARVQTRDAGHARPLPTDHACQNSNEPCCHRACAAAASLMGLAVTKRQ